MVLKHHTMIVHPATLEQMERALGKVCSFTTAVDAEGAKSYSVTNVHVCRDDLTANQLCLLDLAASVRFIPIANPFASEPAGIKQARSPVKPAVHQNMQELRKFLRLDRRARR